MSLINRSWMIFLYSVIANFHYVLVPDSDDPAVDISMAENFFIRSKIWSIQMGMIFSGTARGAYS